MFLTACPSDTTTGADGASTEASTPMGDGTNGTVDETGVPSMTTGTATSSTDSSGSGETGGDGDSTGTPTGTEECADECAEVAEEWQGPLAIVRRSVEEPEPACGAGFTKQVFDGGAEIFDAEHTCACNCDDVECGAAAFEAHDGNSCLGSADVEVLDATEGCYDIPNITTAYYGGALAPPVLDAECTPNDSGTVVAPTDFMDNVILCAPEDASAPGCDSDEVCLARPNAPFMSTLCLLREGDHICPEGTDYSVRMLLHTSLTDSRSCPDCSCSFVDEDCAMDEPALYGTSDCSGPVVGSATQDCLPFAPGDALVSSMSVPAFSGAHACTPDAGTNTPLGGVELQNPTTACCLPEGD